jgi:hypothetical protein
MTIEPTMPPSTPIISGSSIAITPLLAVSAVISSDIKMGTPAAGGCRSSV